ncbi:hypothetical protein FDJ19_gp153 [Vibrio phage Ceto]|uniref:Uncharacterized protein n=1 Tax=Vibrio phage Ceto TaxID=2570300 RepID=A0A2H5BGM9_9CAUD|nr:hypothetical protein FDJ19_gp153 [Vibrio phage Ceto]AUG85145.1 hypothetical protein CETO_163 [Vibrio phage Ceto]
MLNKRMEGKLLSQELAFGITKNVPKARAVIGSINIAEIFEKSRGIISIPSNFKDYFSWANGKPSKHGFNFEARFDFWAESKKGMEGVAFITCGGRLIFPLYRDDDTVRGVDLDSGCITAQDITNLMPLFPRAVLATMTGSERAAFNDFQDHIASLCDMRTRWLEGKEKPISGGRLDPDYEGSITPAAAEAIAELEEPSLASSSWSMVGRRGMGNSPFTVKRDKRPNPWELTNTPEGNVFITKEMLEKAASTTISNETILKGKEDMTKATQVKAGMINVNKEALKQVGYLNAGRASNKLIKESIRPLLNAMFKPTFMQKIAMKLFKMENPVDVALKSGMSDLLCAQMVQAIVEIKGVDNPYVREVTQAGITQAGYELSKAIPFEEAIDKVVANLEKGAEGIVAKISK